MRTNSHPKRPASPLPNQSPFIESLRRRPPLRFGQLLLAPLDKRCCR